MFFLREPSERDVAAFIGTQRNQPFSYVDVGGTSGTPPANFTLDHNRIQLGTGEKVYRRALDAIKQWRQFDLGWVSIAPAGVPLEIGAAVAVKAKAFGLWSLSACRIVYLINDNDPVRRFGFAYGTLPDHAECGEERFSIEWHEENDSVWYDILAFSQPHHPLVRATFPLVRVLQRRFIRDSKRRMIEATQAGPP